MVEINGERLLGDLEQLRTFGAVGGGVVRQTFSDVDMEARRWLVEVMGEADLDAVIDGVGTVYGRSRRSGPTVVIGSHSDTQPEGGWLDGALGVIYGIEVARALAADPDTRHLAVDVASWSDEEGTYTSCLGSHSFVDALPVAAWSDVGPHGETVAEAIERVGLADVDPVRLDPHRHVAYLEAHIEQGPHLEANGKRIGVVTSIVGIRAMHVTFAGEQNHAGSTPMGMRRDAGVALFEFGVRLGERLRALAGPTSVWTIGEAGLVPGGESIIPGRAWCGVQFRDPSDQVLDAFEAAIEDLADEMTADGPVEVTARRRREPMSPTPMHDDVRRHLCAAAAEHHGGEWVEMPSAAIHDATVIGPYLPSGMLFIPSIGGISHDFAEDSHLDDIVAGCQVLALATAALLSEAHAAARQGAPGS